MIRATAFTIKTLYALLIACAVYFRVHLAVAPVLLTVLLASAFIWGDWEERLVMGALAIALEILAVGPALGLFARSFDVDGSRLGVTMVGAVYLALLLIVVVRTPKWWPSWVAAFQFLLVLGHPLFAFVGNIQPWAYASSIVIWTWLQFVAIGCGIFDAWLAKLQSSAAAPAT